MSLFKISDLVTEEKVVNPASATAIKGKLKFFDGKNSKIFEETFQNLSTKENVFFHTRGAWSNIKLLDMLLCVSGKADVYISTWAISAEAIRTLVFSHKYDCIKNLYLVLDRGIRNRKPEIYQELIANFKNICFCKCHAKCTVIKNEAFSITLMGSANYTSNPRIETGAIIFDEAVADENIKWILEEVNNAK